MSVSLVQLLKKKKMKVLGFLLLFFCPHLLSLSSLFVLLCFVPLQEPVSCFIKTLTGLTLCEHTNMSAPPRALINDSIHISKKLKEINGSPLVLK